MQGTCLPTMRAGVLHAEKPGEDKRWLPTGLERSVSERKHTTTFIGKDRGCTANLELVSEQLTGLKV